MILYRISNAKNAKLYFGITSKSLRSRWAQHKWCASNGSEYALHRAMRRHGADAFFPEVISEHSSFDEAKEAEALAILTHGTRRGGYNMTDGGDGFMGGKHSDEARAKMRLAHAGKTISAEHKAALIKANTGRKMPQSHIDALRSRVVSDEEKQRRSERAKGNKWAVGSVRTEEQRAALAEAAASRVMTEETRAKIRAARAQQAPTYGMAGKTHSEEAKAKMREAKIGKKKSPETIEKMRQAARRRVEAKRARDTNGETARG